MARKEIPEQGGSRAHLPSSCSVPHYWNPDLWEVTLGLCIQEEGSGLLRQAQTLDWPSSRCLQTTLGM